MNRHIKRIIGHESVLIAVLGVAFALGPTGRVSAQAEHEVLALERAMADRWGKGDPRGLLDLYAPDITYFDQSTKKRIDGHAAMENYYRPLTGKIHWSKWEIIGPKVQERGDVAVLTYTLHAEGWTWWAFPERLRRSRSRTGIQPPSTRVALGSGR